MVFECRSCTRTFTEKRSLVRHVRNQHGNLWTCPRCKNTFNRYDNYILHERVCEFKATGKRRINNSEEGSSKQRREFLYCEGGALNDLLVNYRADLEGENQENIMETLKESVLNLEPKIDDELTEKHALKFYLSLHIDFHLAMDESYTTEPPVVLSTSPIEVYESSNIREILNTTYENLASLIESFQLRGSGWVLNKLLKLDLHILEFQQVHASSYILLPGKVANKKAVINIKNTDQKCFLWAVIAGTYLRDAKLIHPERLTHYTEYEEKLNLQGITFPMHVKDIPKFERQNDITVSVYGFEQKDEVIYPIKVSKEKKEHHVDLLLVANDDTNHYCYIKDFNRLAGSQYTKHDHKTYFCRFCIHGFSRHTTQDKIQYRRTDEDMKKILEEHENNCFVFGAQRTKFPDDPIIRFKNIKNQVTAPFAVYADFESILKTMQDKNKVQEHVACSYAYHIVSNIPGVEFKPRLYVGLDAAEHFLNSLQHDLDTYIMPLIKKDVEMIWDEAALNKFNAATHCYICEKKFTSPTLHCHNENETEKTCGICIRNVVEKPVRDHSHFTGVFRGAAHGYCNFHYQIEKRKYKLPVLFHNLRGYDAHLIFQKVKWKHGHINVIANNSERYISFSIGRLKFLDSMQFLSASLEKLAAQLKPSQYTHLTKFYPDDTQRLLLTNKGIYPYDYMNNMSRFDETVLPGEKAFYNHLQNIAISKKQYKHAQDVWTGLGCTTMRAYHDHYLKTDVFLLADVFETFRTMVLDTYKLDPIHYYGLPGLSWDAMLRYTKVKFELITDPDMYQMVEKGIRGGICQISHRFSEANHPKMETYDPNQPTKTLMYQDANALYAWAMSMFLPLRSFSWTATDIDYMSVPADNQIGYILEVDLEYPEEIHDAHNDYPLAAEHLDITDDMLSPFQREKFPPIRGSVRKLVPNLHDKERYVVHYRNLQQYISLGMKVKKVHRVLQFEQSDWIKPYIVLNTEKRKEATMKGDKVGKDLFKLFSNIIFGKTCENIRKHINFEIVTTRKAALKRIAKPYFKSSKIFRRDLVGFHMLRPVIELNRPIQVGFAVLELSKYLMYNFHYNIWLKRFPNSKLLFTDTDSLAYEVTEHDVYAGMMEFREDFDFSEYPSDHPLYSDKNMKIAGKFKDECLGQLMLKFIGLRPKLYCFLYNRLALFDLDENGKEIEVNRATDTSTRRIVSSSKNVGKGISGCVRKLLTTDEYEHCVMDLETLTKEMRMIRSDAHQLYTYRINKIALSAFDNKRWIMDDGISTLAHGHYKTI